MARDPYDVLGVSRKATEAEVKKAFRNLAKKHHPDTHQNDPAKVKQFQEISGAYEIIGDKEKRAQYDRGEIDAAGQPRGFDPRAQGGGFRPGGGNGGRQGGPRGARDFEFQWNSGNGEGMRAEDIFSDLFGSGGARRRAGPRRGEDIQLAAEITLEEAANGAVRRVVIGDGKQIDARIPGGVREGQQIRLKGQGGPGVQGGAAGDILITISIAAHPQFSVEGRDLRVDLPVTLKEAVLGGKVPVTTLSGQLTVTVPPNSNSGRVLRLKGKGLPAGGGEDAGDLYARLVVTLPEGGDAELEAFLRTWPAEYDPRASRK
jgi:DnaJ-class molecular chaperone